MVSKPTNLCLPEKFNQETIAAAEKIFYSGNEDLYHPLCTAFRDWGIIDVESYIGLDLAIRMVRKELFDCPGFVSNIENLVLEFQKNTPAGVDPGIMLYTLMKVGVVEVLKTLSSYRDPAAKNKK